MSDDKKLKEAKKFQLITKNPTKKYKLLKKILDKLDEEQRKKFFNESNDEIISTVSSYIGLLETVKESDKLKKSHEQDIYDVLSVLDNIIVSFRDEIKSFWKYDEIANIFKILLYDRNKIEIRKIVFESYLQLLEAYEENIKDIKCIELLNLLKYTVNIDIFDTNPKQPSYIYEIPQSRVLVPTLDLPTKEDSIYFFDRLISFIFKSVDTLKPLFGIVKNDLLSQLYPIIYKEFSQLIDQHKLIEPLPAELHEILINKLYNTKEEMGFVDFLFNEMNYSLTLEILDVTCSKLNIGTHHNVIDRCLDYYWDTLFNKNVQDKISQYSKEDAVISFISSLSHIISLNSTLKEVQPHSNLIKKVLSFYNSLTSIYSDILHKDSWIFIQLLILDLVMQFIQKHDSSKLDDNPSNIVNVADSLFECLLIIWIRSPYTTHEMWMDFMKKFSFTTDWPQAIRQWKKYTILVTDIMCKLYESEDIEIKDDLGLAWTRNLAEQVWFTLLNMIGNIRNIKSSSSFQETLKCFAEMISILSEEEKKGIIPYDSSSFKVFLPWIIEACYAKGELARGIVIALPVLCNLFFKKSDKQLPIEILSHFYHAILFTLKSEYSPVSGQTLIEIRTLFAQDLPYSSILMYDVLSSIENVFRPKYAAPIEVQKSGALLLSSFVSLFEQFEKLDSYSLENEEHLSYQEAKEKISNLITSLPFNALVDESVKTVVSSNLCISLINEITKANPAIPEIHKYFKALLNMISNPSDQVAISASETLRDLSCLFERLNKIDVNIAYSVISTVSNMCCTLIKEGLNNGVYREKLIVSLIELVSYWVTAGPSHLMKSKELSSSVFNLVEYGLFGCEVNLREIGDHPPILSDEEIMTLPNYQLLLNYYAKPKHLSTIIRDSSEILLNSLMSFYNKFPMPLGITMYDKHIVESNDVKSLYFIDNRQRILSIQQLKKEDSSNMVRIISRSSTGKFAWSSTIDYGSDISRTNDYINPLPVGTFQQEKPQPKRSDILTSVLMKFNELHMTCLPKSPKFVNFTSPIKFDDEMKFLTTNIENRINNSIEEVNKAIDNYIENRNSIENDVRVPVKPKTTNYLSRLLLSHLGFLSPQSRRDFCLLKESEDLLKMIEQLDDTPIRKQLSSFVLYIKDGQFNVEESYKDKEISKLYYEFLSGLGNFVDLEQHNGFKSNIDYENAQFGIYYCNIFEELFILPSNECKNEEFFVRMLNEQKVIIIWNEGYKNLELDEIMERYQLDCVIEINTLSTGLFGIKIKMKNDLEQLGPLYNGSVVTKRILPIAVRLTCINICRKLDNGRIPFETRQTIIKDIYENHSKQYSGDIFMDELFQTKAIQEIVTEMKDVENQNHEVNDSGDIKTQVDESIENIDTNASIQDSQQMENIISEEEKKVDENIKEEEQPKKPTKPTLSLSMLPQLSQMTSSSAPPKLSPKSPSPKKVPLAFFPKVPTQHNQ